MSLGTPSMIIFPHAALPNRSEDVPSSGGAGAGPPFALDSAALGDWNGVECGAPASGGRAARAPQKHAARTTPALSCASRSPMAAVIRPPARTASAAAACSASVRLGVGIAIGIGIDSHHGVLGRFLADRMASRSCPKLMLCLDSDNRFRPRPRSRWVPNAGYEDESVFDDISAAAISV